MKRLLLPLFALVALAGCSSGEGAAAPQVPPGTTAAPKDASPAPEFNPPAANEPGK